MDKLNGRYNDLYRLKKVVYPDAVPGRSYSDQTHEWTYDAIGNRLTQTVTNRTDGSVQDTIYHYAQGANGNSQKLEWTQAVGEPMTAYTYNSSGDLLQKAGPGGSESFTYDILGKMKSYTGPDGLTIGMRYDAEGKRVQQIDPDGASRGFLYDNEDLIYTRWQREPWTYKVDHYLHGTGIDEPLSSWKIFQASPYGVITLRELYLHADALGSIRQMWYPQYDHLTELDYDAFGALAYNPDELDTSWGYGYTGREFFGDNYYFYRARYYEPGVGRFTQRDPLDDYAQRFVAPSGYIYSDNLPTMYIDPFGLSPCPEHIKTFLCNYLDILKGVSSSTNTNLDLIITHSAHESGWCAAHCQELHNLFGIQVRAPAVGNRNFSSFQESANYYANNWGPRINGSQTIVDFLVKLVDGPIKYNVNTKRYKEVMKGMYSDWMSHKEDCIKCPCN